VRLYFQVIGSVLLSIVLAMLAMRFLLMPLAKALFGEL
jgi:hypothetical protein